MSGVWVWVGLGLAYSFRMTNNVEEGTMSFSLFKSSNLPAAYAESRKLVDEFATGKVQ